MFVPRTPVARNKIHVDTKCK